MLFTLSLIEKFLLLELLESLWNFFFLEPCGSLMGFQRMSMRRGLEWQLKLHSIPTAARLPMLGEFPEHLMARQFLQLHIFILLIISSADDTSLKERYKETNAETIAKSFLFLQVLKEFAVSVMFTCCM